MNPKEAYFYKLKKSKKTYHDKHGHSSKIGSGKGNRIPKRYKYEVDSAVKADLSIIKRNKKVRMNCTIN